MKRMTHGTPASGHVGLQALDVGPVRLEARGVLARRRDRREAVHDRDLRLTQRPHLRLELRVPRPRRYEGEGSNEQRPELKKTQFRMPSLRRLAIGTSALLITA